MASSDTEVANLAVSHLGIGKEIANLETENSQEANAMRRFFKEARDMTLSQFTWPFARKFVTLSLVSDDLTDVNDREWGFSYRYPADCVHVRRIVSGTPRARETRQGKNPYQISRDTQGLLIFTDVEDAKLEYTFRDTEVQRYPSDFVMALSLCLAWLAAPRLTKGDPFRLQERIRRAYENILDSARSRSINEQQDPEEPESEMVRARNDDLFGLEDDDRLPNRPI